MKQWSGALASYSMVIALYTGEILPPAEEKKKRFYEGQILRCKNYLSGSKSHVFTGLEDKLPWKRVMAMEGELQALNKMNSSVSSLKRVSAW